MSEVFFAYSNIDEIRDEYYLTENYVMYEDDTCVIGCDHTRFAKDDTTAVAMFGEIFNIGDFGYDIDEYTDAQIVLKLIETEDPEDLCAKFTGCFTIFIYEMDFKTWILLTDAFGMYYPFYYVEDDEFIISMNLNDFKNKFFDINPPGVDKLIDEEEFNIKETPIDGVYKLLAGTLLRWPDQSTLQYIDVYEELERAYNNKIKITTEEAIDHIDAMLRKTVMTTSRNYDTDRMATMKSDTVDGILAESTVMACGITPRAYSLVYPLHKQLPHITQRKATSENKKRQKILDKLTDKLGLSEDRCDFIVDNDRLEEYDLFSSDERRQYNSPWSSARLFDYSLGKALRDEDISCVYNSDLGYMIFLNRMMHYIIYLISHEVPVDEIDNITNEQLHDMFHDTLHDSSNYVFDDFKFYKRGRKQIKNGYIHYLIERMKSAKGRSSERDVRLKWKIPYIGLYKDYKLWSFILSLPHDIFSESSLNAVLQKGVVEKQRDIKKFAWPIRLWQGWSHRQIVTFDKKVDELPKTNKLVYYHNDNTLADLKAAIKLFEEIGVEDSIVHRYRLLEKDSDKLDDQILKVLYVYYWIKSWLK